MWKRNDGYYPYGKGGAVDQAVEDVTEDDITLVISVNLFGNIVGHGTATNKQPQVALAVSSLSDGKDA